MMVKYKITFDFNIDDILNSVDDDENIEILEIDDEEFDKTFDSDSKIKEFEKWYNDTLADEEKINVANIKYNRSEELTGILIVDCNVKLPEPNEFAKELVFYLFEGEWPTIQYSVSGINDSEYNVGPENIGYENEEFEYVESNFIHSYSNITIKEL